MTLKLISFSDLNERIVERVGRAADRRQHDDAMRNPAIAREHEVARSRSASRGEPDCIYCQ
jgi:hypothetical protein